MTTLQQLLNQIVYDLTRPLFLKRMAWVAAFWALTIAVILLNIDYLKTNYPDPARPPDRLLDLIPESEAFITVGELLSATEVILVIAIFVHRRFRGAPHLLFLVALMFMLRSFAMTLTPLAQIQPPSENYAEGHFIAQTFYYGMFFSGHTASAFIQALYFKGHKLRPLLILLASLQAFSLIASWSHYSIDVFGGLFVAYFITHFDFMRLVPNFLYEVRWLPWYTPQHVYAYESPEPVRIH